MQGRHTSNIRRRSDEEENEERRGEENDTAISPNYVVVEYVPKEAKLRPKQKEHLAFEEDDGI